MIVSSIKINNFLCYSGLNEFTFTKGLNVIIGDNNSGKTSLYDAFWWVFHNEVYDSLQGKILSTTELRKDLVSDKAKSACVVGESVKATVSIEFYHEEKKMYFIFERRYTIDKLSDYSDTEKGWFEQAGSIYEIRTREESSLNQKIVTKRDEIARCENRVMPDSVKPYMWFRGEQLDKIMDFERSATLDAAIKLLSDISIFEDYKTLGAAAKKSAQAEYDSVSNFVNRANKEVIQLREDIADLERDIRRKEAEEGQELDNKLRFNERKSELSGRVEDAVVVKDLQNTYDKFNDRMASLSRSIAEKKGEIDKLMFKNGWIVRNTLPLIEAFNKKHLDYTARRQKIVEERSALRGATMKVINRTMTKNVPQTVHLERFLEVQRCQVCDREAPKGSEPWLKIKELLDFTLEKEVKTTPLIQRDLGNQLQQLSQVAYGMRNKTYVADEEITEQKLKINQLEKDYKDIKRERDSTQSLLNERLAGGSSDALTAQKITADYNGLTIEIANSSSRLTRIQTELKTKRDDLQNKRNALSTATENDAVPEGIKERLRVLTEFAEITAATRNRVYDNIVTRLQTEADGHYQNMTSEVIAAHGNIEFLKEQTKAHPKPVIVKEAGIRMSRPNEGNVALMKFSVMMAIITAKRSSAAANLHTLISDAPTTKLGENYSIGLCKALAKVYTQSIIISKEFYTDNALRKQLLEDVENLGKVYEITPSITVDEQRNKRNRDTLSTQIKDITPKK